MSLKTLKWASCSAEFFEGGTVVALGTLRMIPDLFIICLGI